MAVIYSKKHVNPKLIGSVVFALVATVVFVIKLDHPILAFDLWWHMAIGRYFLETGTLVFDHSLFTWADADSNATYNAWMAQILLHWIYEQAGLAGLLVTRYVVFSIFLLLAIYYGFKKRVLGNPVSWLVILLGVMFVWPSYIVKPELFSIGFMSVFVWLYYYIRTNGASAKYLSYLFPLLLVIWVNTHGAFFISSVLFAALVIGELLNSRYCQDQAMAPAARKHLFIAIALCVPALLLNPYGYQLPYDIINTILTPALHPSATIKAYFPTSHFNDPPYYMLDNMLIAMLLFVALVWQKLKNRHVDWVVILAFVSYCALFVQMGRLTFFLGPVFVFAALDLLAYRDDSWFWPGREFSQWLLVAACVPAVALIGYRVLAPVPCNTPNSVLDGGNRVGLTNAPLAEADYIAKNLKKHNIGNTYTEGGYLIYRLWPEKKVLIDTREFPFVHRKQEHFDFLNGINVERYVDKYNADYWLINYGYIKPFEWFAHSPNWKIAYLGPIGAVFVPKSEFAGVTELSNELSGLVAYDRLAIAFGAALQLEDLTFAKELQHIIEENLADSCQTNRIFLREVAEILAGYEAFGAGDYLAAANYLGETKTSIRAPEKAKEAMMILASTAWSSGDFGRARDWCQKSLSMGTNTVDIYNLMVADWRVANLKGLDNKESDTLWKGLAESIRDKDGELPPGYEHIMATAKAMIDGRYDGNAPLLSRFPQRKVAK